MLTKNKMAKKIPTQKPVWLNDDGSVANVVYTPVNPNETFSMSSFMENVYRTEQFGNSDKAKLSQILFGDDRVESISDRDFGSLKKNLGKNIVDEGMNGYVANNAGTLINVVALNGSEQVERFILGKNRNATTSTFRINAQIGATQGRINAVNKYNGAADAVDAYHTEIEDMEARGDLAYVTGKLNNINAVQMAVIMSATGSRPGDASKIARAYKNFHVATALETVADVGIPKYVATNLETAKQLETKHKIATKNLEETTEKELIDLGVGATRSQVKDIYQVAEARKEIVARAFQHADTDARYLFKDLTGKANDAAVEYLSSP